MRTNKYGVRGLKGVQLPKAFVYFWVPPVSLQKAGIFHYTTLGSDFASAVAQACTLNTKLDAYRGGPRQVKPKLLNAGPLTVGFLIREFEASPRFAHYAPRTREDYSNICRDVETQVIDGKRMFRELNVAEVSKQLAYAIYEQSILAHGLAQANKISSVCQRVFRYGMLKRAEITTNPFSDLDRMTPPIRQLSTAG